MSANPVIVWFRNDLRLHDHPALTAAVKSGTPLVLVYILDDDAAGHWKLGGASRWWLANSLDALAKDIEHRGGRLLLRRGETSNQLQRLAEETHASAIYFTRGYEPSAVALESRLHSKFAKTQVALKRYGGRLIREPEELRTAAGKPFQVYSPFWRAFTSDLLVAKELSAPRRLVPPAEAVASEKLTDWNLLPSKPDWSSGLADTWVPGEEGARSRLKTFAAGALATYAQSRDRPDQCGTSRLSPHLAFGEISPAACWRAAVHAQHEKELGEKSVETFMRELVWREFSYSLLFHLPEMPEKALRTEFSAFPWRNSAADLKAWRRGETGYPIVDAGMRELWSTGYMHNRVRMIVASFLTKHLLLHWTEGEACFWDTLVDADLANNSASWQWVAGCGADAAPYFRIFNPILQGQKFDPEGKYVSKWVPELARLASELHSPWAASVSALQRADVKLGKTYPEPIVDHQIARERALKIYQNLPRSTS